MRLIATGFALMTIGLLTLFAMVVGVVESALWPALLAYSATFIGMMLGIFALAERFRRRR